MKKCSKCGKEIQEYEVICPECGYKEENKKPKSGKAKSIFKRMSTILLMVCQYLATVVLLITGIALISLHEEGSIGLLFGILIFFPVCLICLILDLILGSTNIASTLTLYKDKKTTKIVNCVISGVAILIGVVFSIVFIVIFNK